MRNTNACIAIFVVIAEQPNVSSKGKEQRPIFLQFLIFSYDVALKFCRVSNS